MLVSLICIAHVFFYAKYEHNLSFNTALNAEAAMVHRPQLSLHTCIQLNI